MTKKQPDKNGRAFCVAKSGELHQQADDASEILTTAQGAPVADDQNSLRGGSRGPTLLEDQILRDKLFHFDHERIPERVVHARGYGAHGYFENYDSLANITRADLFQRKGEQTPVFVRFSTVAGNKGSADLARDVRGFATKFYSREGNWDLVGNNMPIFFIQDAMKFPDLVHAAKVEPDRGFPQAQTAHDNFWDFASLTTESTHMLLWIMSDRAIPRSFRFMEGFGVHTFRLVNSEGKSTFVKFHWKPKQGLQSVLWDEALKINGADPDFHRRDLWDAINSGDFPAWELGMQLFDDDFVEKFSFDVLDATKLIPEEEVPIRLVGKMVLNRVVDNFFAETEQVAFCTQNIVPGIDFSNDPLLQGRNFSYLDTQLKRLGSPNFTHLAINAPKCPMHHFQQDGHMAMRNPTGRINYEPNSRGAEGGPRETPRQGFNSWPEPLHETKTRERSPTFADHYSQANQFFRSQTPVEQQHIRNAFIFELSKVEYLPIRERMVANLLNVDAGLAQAVADGLGLQAMPKASIAAMPPIHDLPQSPTLSILKNGPDNFKGRKLGVLMTDGANAELFAALQAAVKDEGAMLKVIAPAVGGVIDSAGKHIEGNEKIGGGPSVVFDAVVLLLSDKGANDLQGNAGVRDFITDAFSHCKFIGYSAPAKPLLIACVGGDEKLDVGCIELDGAEDPKKFVASCHQLRLWSRVKQ